MKQIENEYTIEWTREQIKDMVDRINANYSAMSMIYGFVRKCFELSGEKTQKKL